MEKKISVMGIDPGIDRTGWGVISLESGQCAYIDCSSIRTSPKEDLTTRLLKIFENLKKLIDQLDIKHIGIEDTYVSVNAKTSLYLAHARAAALLAGGHFGLIAQNYQAKTIKKSLTGDGNAEKEQLAKMLKLRLPGFQVLKDKDAMDAVAIAFCHAQHLREC